MGARRDRSKSGGQEGGVQEVATAVDPPADKTGEGSQEGKPEKIYGVLGDSGRATPVVLVRPRARADTDADVSNVVIPKFLHSLRHETALSLAGWLTSAERPAGSSRYWVPRREKEHARTANGEVIPVRQEMASARRTANAVGLLLQHAHTRGEGRIAAPKGPWSRVTFFRDNDGASRGGRCAPAAENHTTGGGAPRVVGSCVPLLVRMAVAGGSCFFPSRKGGVWGEERRKMAEEKKRHPCTRGLGRRVGRSVDACGGAVAFAVAVQRRVDATTGTETFFFFRFSFVSRTRNGQT